MPPENQDYNQKIVERADKKSVSIADSLVHANIRSNKITLYCNSVIKLLYTIVGASLLIQSIIFILTKKPQEIENLISQIISAIANFIQSNSNNYILGICLITLASLFFIKKKWR